MSKFIQNINILQFIINANEYDVKNTLQNIIQSLQCLYISLNSVDNTYKQNNSFMREMVERMKS